MSSFLAYAIESSQIILRIQFVIVLKISDPTLGNAL